VVAGVIGFEVVSAAEIPALEAVAELGAAADLGDLMELMACADAAMKGQLPAFAETGGHLKSIPGEEFLGRGRGAKRGGQDHNPEFQVSISHRRAGIPRNCGRTLSPPPLAGKVREISRRMTR
jgi:hypothetical protein